MTALSELDRDELARILEGLGADGWLLFDFHGCNPVAQRLLPGGMGTRRTWVWIPRKGPMTAIVHRIELQPFDGFEGTILPFARHAELHAALSDTLSGKVAAMEVSARDAVPTTTAHSAMTTDRTGTIRGDHEEEEQPVAGRCCRLAATTTDERRRWAITGRHWHWA